MRPWQHLTSIGWCRTLWTMLEGHVWCRHAHVYSQRMMMAGRVWYWLFIFEGPRAHVWRWLTILCTTKAIQVGNVRRWVDIVCKTKGCGKTTSDIRWLFCADKRQWEKVSPTLTDYHAGQRWWGKAMHDVAWPMFAGKRAIEAVYTWQWKSDVHKPQLIRPVCGRHQLKKV